jgi:hypothetical protein
MQHLKNSWQIIEKIILIIKNKWNLLKVNYLLNFRIIKIIKIRKLIII